MRASATIRVDTAHFNKRNGCAGGVMSGHRPAVFGGAADAEVYRILRAFLLWSGHRSRPCTGRSGSFKGGRHGMDLFNLAIFRMARVKMEWVGQRQEVLAENIANADTPNYKASDITPLDFKAMAEQATTPQTTMTVTDPAHMQPALVAGPFDTETTSHPYETKLDGNPVTIEDQMQKMSDDRLQYTFALNLFHKNLALLKEAAGGSGSSS